MKYKDVVTEKNSHKVYLCKLTDGTEIKLQVHDSCESAKIDMVMYDYESSDDKQYREDDIAEILHEVEIEEDDSTYYESFDEMDFKSIEKYLIQNDTYRYTNKQELKDIYTALNKPILSGVGVLSDEAESEYLDSVKDFGIVFYWSEYDDFSCYGDGFTHKVKIIEGGKVI